MKKKTVTEAIEYRRSVRIFKDEDYLLLYDLGLYIGHHFVLVNEHFLNVE